jgi:pseudouridine-5'-phosphate glycosidase
VIGYGCDRLPFFLVRSTDLPLEHRADDPRNVVGAAAARASLGIRSALLVCNPVPEEHAMTADDVSAAVEACEERAASQAVTGKDVTPFLLACVAERTEGRSLEANLALLTANAGLAGEVAMALSVGPMS